MSERPVVSHQTVRLTRGAHRSPAEGACVMELASMLAGEPFSDRPSTACPVLGAFLRAYNDSVGPAARQDLLPCASLVVGTFAAGLVRERVERLVAVSVAFHDAQPRWRRVLHWHRRGHLVRLAEAPLGAARINELGLVAAGALSCGAGGHAVAMDVVRELAELTPPAARRAPAVIPV